MLTRPGASPGRSWMRRINESIPPAGPKPEVPSRLWKWYWLIYGALMTLWLLVLPLFRPSLPSAGSVQNYESETRIAGLPLVARGEAPRGIIAIGGRPIGGLPAGVVAVGGVGVGVFCLSGLAVGLLALGGVAVGWWALGGGAVGYYAFGGVAMGAYAYAGHGVALGYYEASGRQKERLFE